MPNTIEVVEQVAVVEVGSDQVVEIEVQEQVVEIELASTGPQGAKGDKGDTGPTGAPGGGTHTHDQGVPSDSWLIAHPLSRFPSVTVVDSAGTVQYGTVTYIDASTVRIDFKLPFGGKAYLN